MADKVLMGAPECTSSRQAVTISDASKTGTPRTTMTDALSGEELDDVIAGYRVLRRPPVIAIAR
jgi:hypothetical protein